MKLVVVKIGGNIIDDEEQLSSFLNDFASIPDKKILIHGGGKIATEMSMQLGIEPKMLEGRRITDADTLRVVQMVYGGWINKNIVARLQSRSCNAIGLTGADANIIQAYKRPVKKVDYGFVGDIEKVNVKQLAILLNAGFAPVIAPLTHDGSGQMLNTNADTMASAVSVAMSNLTEVSLIYCFEKSGVLRNIADETSLIKKIDVSEYKKYKSEGIISQGMIPKLDNAFDALKEGVQSVIICHARDLKTISQNNHTGTRLEL